MRIFTTRKRGLKEKKLSTLNNIKNDIDMSNKALIFLENEKVRIGILSSLGSDDIDLSLQLVDRRISDIKLRLLDLTNELSFIND